VELVIVWKNTLYNWKKMLLIMFLINLISKVMIYKMPHVHPLITTHVWRLQTTKIYKRPNGLWRSPDNIMNVFWQYGFLK